MKMKFTFEMRIVYKNRTSFLIKIMVAPFDKKIPAYRKKRTDNP